MINIFLAKFAIHKIQSRAQSKIKDNLSISLDKFNPSTIKRRNFLPQTRKKNLIKVFGILFFEKKKLRQRFIFHTNYRCDVFPFVLPFIKLLHSFFWSLKY